jgi:quaternary ammonium compound-resistance protein SugE
VLFLCPYRLLIRSGHGSLHWQTFLNRRSLRAGLLIHSELSPMQPNLLSWICLIGAGLCQMGWTYSLKFVQLTGLKTLRWANFLTEGWIVVGPWLGYIVFGALNSVLLSIAMRTISTTTTFAVWMALSLICIKAGDIIWFRASWSVAELLFIGLIAIGIVGLKMVPPVA